MKRSKKSGCIYAVYYTYYVCLYERLGSKTTQEWDLILEEEKDHQTYRIFWRNAFMLSKNDFLNTTQW